jgi:hypothetical protein
MLAPNVTSASIQAFAARQLMRYSLSDFNPEITDEDDVA